MPLKRMRVGVLLARFAGADLLARGLSGGDQG